MKKSRMLLILILFGALAIRLMMLFIETPPLRSDSLTYHDIAKSILEGRYELHERPTALVVPGYPVFLAGVYSIFGDGQFGMRLVQSILDVLTCFIFFLVCSKIFDEKNSLVALSIFAFFPSNILYTQTALTETLFGLIAMLVFLATVSFDLKKKIFFVGILFGIAILVRSSFSMSVILVPIFLLIYRRQLFEVGNLRKPVMLSFLFAAGLLLALMPWLSRNKSTMGAYTLATQGGSALWEGNNPLATGTWNKQAADANPLFEEPDEVYREREFRRQAIDFIKNNPAKFIELGFRKLGYLFSSERMVLLYFMDSPPGMSSTQIYRTVSPVYMIIVNLPYFAVILAGAWGLLLPMKHKFFTVGFIITWMATMFVFVALPRYHYVLIPFFVIGAVNLFSRGFGKLRSMKAVSKFAGAAFTLFLLAVWAAEFYLLYFKSN